MKIEKITLKNLNSLKGQWTIDFTDPTYAQNPIFAITGPTGSGKSTIIDAIGLALYAKTPRMNKVTKSNNEILTKGEKDCLAEVQFVVGEKRYYASLRQHKSSKGNLQDRNHTLQVWEGDGWREIASRSQVESKVTEITQLDYNQFLRTVVLAQGQFDAFLRASNSDKSGLLEKITNTTIYSELSTLCYRHWSALNQETERLEAEKKKLTSSLQEVDTSTLEADLKAQEVALAELVKEGQTLEKEAAWWRKEAELKAEEEALKHAQSTLSNVKEKQQTLEKQLALHKEAADIRPVYTSLTDKTRAVQKEELGLQNCQNEASRTQLALQAQEATLAETKTAYEAFMITYAEDEKTLKKAMELDSELGVLREKTSYAKARLEDAQTQHTQKQKAVVTQTTRLTRSETALKACVQQLTESPCPLFVSTPESTFVNLRREVEKAQEALQTVSTQFQVASHAVNEKEARCTKAQQALEKANGELDKARTHQEDAARHLSRFSWHSLEDFDKAVMALTAERHHFDASMSFKDQRQQLEPHQPCPLCGSTHHPYVDSYEELLAKHEALLTRLNALSDERRQFQEAKSTLDKALVLLASAHDKRQVAQTELEEATKALHEATITREQVAHTLKTHEEALLQASNTLIEALGTFAPESLSREHLDHVFTLARNHIMTLKKEAELKEQVEVDSTDLNALKAEIPALEAQVQSNKVTYENALSTQSNKEAERQALFADTTDVFAHKLKARHQEAQAKLENAQTLHQSAKEAALQASTRVESASLALTQARSMLQEAQIAWDDALKSKALTQDLFTRHYLDEQTYALVSKELQEAQETWRQFENRVEQWKGKCADLATTPKPERTLEDNALRMKALTHESQAIQMSLDRLRLLKAKYESLKTDLVSLDTKLHEHRARIAPWETLNHYIGSADGQKFRNYAQSITLKHLLIKANEMLSLLNDRYQLTLNPDELLGLAIIDKHMNNTIRTTNNLSGGEAFMVSLSLALGLAQHGKGLGVNTLFLDEGFGTLDEESLTHAMEMLSTLQEQGKMIGLISHVERLKEAIPTKIVLTPIGQTGHSKLEGPGVSHA